MNNSKIKGLLDPFSPSVFLPRHAPPIDPTGWMDLTIGDEIHTTEKYGLYQLHHRLAGAAFCEPLLVSNPKEDYMTEHQNPKGFKPATTTAAATAATMSSRLASPFIGQAITV